MMIQQWIFDDANLYYNTMMSPITKILNFAQTNLKNHKKKYIALSLILILGYYIKRKLTSQRLIQLLLKVVSIIEYIPLPNPPKYRQVNSYQSLDPFNFEVLKGFMNIQAIGAKLQNQQTKAEEKQELWRQMMKNVLTGYSFTVSFFDLTQVFNMVKCKYAHDFRYFGMEEEFTNYIAGLNTYFSNNLANLFTYLKIHQQNRIEEYDPNNKYSPRDIYKLLEQLSLSILDNTEDISQEIVIVKNKKLLDDDVSRLFYTDLEKQEPRERGRFARAVGWIWQKLWSVRVEDHSYDPSKYRFSTIKHLFRMGLFEINDLRELFKNHDKATQLFDLVNQEVFDILRSLNFHMLWEASVKYNTRKFINRLHIFLKRKEYKSMLLGNYFSFISKISLEEFANPLAIETNSKLLDKSLKEAMKLKIEPNPSQNSIRETNILLQELIELKRLEIAQKELLLKYFHERGDVEIDVTREGRDNQEEMKEFLNKISQMGMGMEGENGQPQIEPQ